VTGSADKVRPSGRAMAAAADWAGRNAGNLNPLLAGAARDILGRTCSAELCPYWPGEGCMRGVMPCESATAAGG